MVRRGFEGYAAGDAYARDATDDYAYPRRRRVTRTREFPVPFELATTDARTIYALRSFAMSSGDDVRRIADTERFQLMTADDPRAFERRDEARFKNVASRLWKVFGGGDNPALRRRFYERLEREVQLNGEHVYRLVQGAARAATTANNPGRYFCTAVSRRLREAGYLVDEDAF